MALFSACAHSFNSSVLPAVFSIWFIAFPCAARWVHTRYYAFIHYCETCVLNSLPTCYKKMTYSWYVSVWYILFMLPILCFCVLFVCLFFYRLVRSYQENNLFGTWKEKLVRPCEPWHHQWACHILACENEVDYIPLVENKVQMGLVWSIKVSPTTILKFCRLHLCKVVLTS